MKISKKKLAMQKQAIKDALTKKLSVRTTRGLRKSSGEQLVEVGETRYSLIKYIKGCHFNDWEGAEDEHRVAKAYGTDKPTHGGFFLPEVISPDIIERLREQSVLNRLPIRSVDMGDARKVVYNRVVSSVAISWGAENEQISEDDSFSTGRKTLEPKKCVCLYKDSRELFEHAPAFESLMREDVARGMALDLDSKAFEGLGGDTLLGIYYNPLVPLTDLSGAIDEDNVKDTINAMRILHANEPTAYVTYPTVQKKLAQLKDAEGRPIFGSGPGENYIKSLYGAPLYSTTQIAATLRPAASETYMLCGDWNQFLLGNWGGFRVEVTTEGGNAFEYDQVYVKFVRWVGSLLRHDDSFHVIKGIDIS